MVVWDAENPASDAYLTGALSVAKALSVRDAGGSGHDGIDTEALEKAIREIERQAADSTRSPRAPRPSTAM